VSTSAVWLIPAFPLAGALLNILFGRLTGRRAHWIALPASAASFVAACVVFARVGRGEPFTATLFSWIAAGDFAASVTAYVDPLTAVMLLVITGVGGLIHLYSIGYMHDDPGYARFFAYLNLFVFSMTMLVLAGNFLLLYVFWEAVGLCSYLLIGFWYQKDSAAAAGKKAFIVNRVGDVGFGLGIIWIWTALGTLDYAAVFKGAETLPAATATGIALLLFMGACGKSAQLPLHTWLPDAMEGPTPVSALIHAATMVTAGVYMVARSHAIFERSGFALDVVAWVGVATALFAATIGLVQTDIKRVLAYSTVSQLGYMFAAVGLGAYAIGVFHLVTHAFFKALLFLGAGSVIHGMRGEQDLRKMGGLAPRMVTTTITMTIGALGLSGFPGLAGFFSKDEILAVAFHEHRVMWALLLIGAFMTAFYTFRLIFLAFFGAPA
jgi:NADH-quinone oxidoreductase subunit L